jgi:hypothetical protein
MDFLNDKKNQPIIIGVTIAIVLAVGVFLYLQNRPQQPEAMQGQTDLGASPAPADGTSAATPPAQTGTPAPDQTGQAPPPPTGVTPAPAAAGVPAGAPVGSRTVAVKPMEKFRPDPFAALWRPKVMGPKVAPPREAIPYPTWLIIPKKAPVVKQDNTGGEAIDTRPRRMAGVMFGNTVSAILETGSETLVVRPGDVVENSTMRVEKIEPTRIVLKSLAPGRARYVDVKMAAGLGSPITNVAGPTAASPTAPTPRPTTPGPPPPRGGYGRGS